ncbi:MAG: hypothetical protein SGPRY_009878 [Prymnesium sp.]
MGSEYNDEGVEQGIAQDLPEGSYVTGKGCIVGIVDVECTWPADLFNEVEQAQLTEQAVCPVSGTFLTQLRNPRWLKYPVQIPLDALPEGSEMDANGNLLPLSSRDRPPLYQPGSCANLIDGDDMGLGLLGGDMVRQLQSADGAGEKEKRLKKLQKVNFCPACNPSPSVFSNLICNQALRQIGELKEKQAAGAVLEKTQVRLA